MTSVIVTHDLDLCFAISDRVGLLGAGRFLCQHPDEEMGHMHRLLDYVNETGAMAWLGAI